MGFIYKITNTSSKKCYIGQTSQSNPEERWKKHQCAISRGAGCPALRDAIKKYGIQQFTFEVLIICFDMDRFIYEREYIKKYNSVVPNGYNILEGGEGGGFKGKRHTEETKEAIRKRVKERYEDRNERQLSRERALKQMAEVKRSGVDWGSKVKMSEKFKTAIEEGRVGGKKEKGDTRTRHTEETNDSIRKIVKGRQLFKYNALEQMRDISTLVNNKNIIEEHIEGAVRTGGRLLASETKEKIRKSVKMYFSKTEDGKEVNIEKCRTAMAKAAGVRVKQITKEGVLVKTYTSIQEAARENSMYKSAIQAALDNPKRSAGGFVWKREDVITHV